jgi:hypothetical protein
MFMKLSEALALRADTQKRIMQLRERLRASALVQEGEAPPEDPQELLAELDRLLGQLRDLVGRINRSNLAARLPDGTSLTDALAARRSRKRSSRLPVRISLFQRDGAGSTPACSTVAMV